ncbi:MAG: type II secretion system F family protein [Pseudomonadota bacterium]
MLDLFYSTFTNPTILFGIVTAVAVFATILTVAMPMMQGDQLGARMKTVALERDQIRARERARLAAEKNNKKTKAVKQEPAAIVKNLVNKLNLRNLLADESTTKQLTIAGLRGQAPLFIFLFARFVLPFIFFAGAAFYLFVVSQEERSTVMKLFFSLIAAYGGFYAPILFLKNKVKQRQQDVGRAWPDALDLTLICVESGMTIEAAFRRVSEEIGIQSVALAEELVLTTAELSYLADRRQAYENLAERTGLSGVKDVVTTLIQAERYGTPLGTSLRVLSQENRDQRMMMAEKKAAALPPKLTVPMIVFFLPVLFAVIMSPAVMQAMRG